MEIHAQSFKYPPCLIKAAKEQLYQPKADVFRVSELVDAPLIKQLTLKHWNECTSEIENSIPALMGTAWHSFLEGYSDPDDYMIEKRLWAECNGMTITGQMDLFQKKLEQIEDHKSLSAIKLIKGDVEDWECRMNIYAWLCEQNNITVKSLLIWAFVKDWSKYKMMQSPDYPRRRLVPIKLKLWTKEQQQAYVESRVAVHSKPAKECTDKEKWARESTFALKKEGRKSAVKVESDRNTLLAYMREKGISLDQKHSIEERPGECVRCNDWCMVRDFCSYAPKIQEKAA